MPVDYVYRIEQPHVSGQLAKVCAAIAEANGVIGDILTIQIGRERSIREISIEVARRRPGRARGGDAGGARGRADDLLLRPGAPPPRGRQARRGGPRGDEIPPGHARPLHAGRRPRVHGDRRGPGPGEPVHHDRPHRRDLHQRHARPRARRHRPPRRDAGDGGQGALLQTDGRDLGRADPDRHRRPRRVRRDGQADRARLRRDPPRGHQRPPLLRDRVTADRRRSTPR